MPDFPFDPARLDPAVGAITFGGLAALTALAGLFALRLAAGFTRRNAGLFAAFAAGLIVGIALLRLVPESLQGGDAAPWLIFAGFGAGFLLQRGMEAGFGQGSAAGLALAPVLAIALHSLLDGVVYAVAFAMNPVAAVGAGAGLVAHEFPEAVICFFLLQRAGLSDRWALVFAFIAAGATTLAAALAATPAAAALEPQTLHLAYAFTAGLLLNIGAGHLLSHAGDAGWARATPAVLAGGGAAALVALAHPPHLPGAGHDHEHDHRHFGEAPVAGLADEAQELHR